MIPQEEEFAIVRAVLAGEKQQYARLVNEYQQIVANLTYKLCGQQIPVEDVVQQVFVDLYSSLPRFRFESRLSTFIYRITVNVVNKMLAHKKRYVSFDEGFETDSVSGPNREEQIVKEERLRQLRNAIGQLKYEQRTALVLYTYDEFSYMEIAEVMQVSLSKVESLIFRAKKNLQKMMNVNTSETQDTN